MRTSISLERRSVWNKPSFGVLAAALLVLTIAAQAAAQEEAPSPNDEIARRTFEAGRQAFAAGDYEAALAHFQEAYELSQRPGLLYNIAQSLDRLRRDEETVRVFREYLERVPTTRSRAEVEARIRVLERIIADRQQEEEARRQAEEEAAQARERRQQQEEAERRDERTAAAAPPASRPPLHPAIFIATGGLALVGGGLAIWTGLETLSLSEQYYDTGPGEYDEARALLDEGTTYELATNVLIGTSAGLAAVAVVLAIFTDWGGGAAASETAWMPLLDLGPDRAAVGASLRF